MDIYNGAPPRTMAIAENFPCALRHHLAVRGRRQNNVMATPMFYTELTPEPTRVYGGAVSSIRPSTSPSRNNRCRERESAEALDDPGNSAAMEDTTVEIGLKSNCRTVAAGVIA